MSVAVALNKVLYSVKDGCNKRNLLNEISCSFEENKITAISGSSGSGKTTLLYAIAGLLSRIDSGEVSVFGTSVYQLSSKEKDAFRLHHISMIFQGLNLFSFMNVKQNICVPLYAKNKKVTKETDERISYYLEVMGLGQIQERELKSLSGGEQQRIAIIRAIIDKPKIVLCDEPTASLDQENSVLFLEQLRKLILENHMTAILVSHDDIVKSYADASMRMADGSRDE
ncbi:MAG: ATP-binding cassette domain-containing protein [Clostridium sp.]|nr:ATP-binding cassette domain-containing protein [Clostridium sp.]